MSLGEPLMRPTTMLFRNQAAMEVEEVIRANPIDGVVLLAGCDKTTPALLMGAASCDVPAILVSGGPMLNGRFRGRPIGSGTDVFRFVEDLQAGRMTAEEFAEAEGAMSRSAGSCMTMGTASTMAALAEAMGIAPRQNAAIPAVDSRRAVLAEAAGHRIVGMVREDLRISRILTRHAFENAIIVTGAIGGSTNAVVHLLALAGRLGVPLDLDDWDRLGRDVPCLVDLMPSGRFLMEDFHEAGGLPAVMAELRSRLRLDAPTVEGTPLSARLDGASCWNREVIRTLAEPFKPQGGLAVLRGSLAPDGAVIKPSAATPALMRHRGRAVVFEDMDDLKARIDAPDLDVDADSVLVLKHAGPVGYPGMAEVGNLPIPAKLVRQGVRDMVRVSDGRMSGTAYGTVVLHVAPEAAVGGPLAHVRTGDPITLDVDRRLLQLEVDAAELDRRRDSWTPPPRAYDRGYGSLFLDHVLQADRGVDFDFLVGASGHAVARESF